MSGPVDDALAAEAAEGGGADPVRDLLGAVVTLVSNWNSVETQGGIAREVGIDVSEGDVRALYVIGQRGGSVRAGDLGAELAVPRPAVSKAVARLEAAGLVLRRRNVARAGGAGDGRAVHVDLTAAGRAAYERLVGAGIRMVERAAAGLDTAELVAFAKLARELTRAFEE